TPQVSNVVAVTFTSAALDPRPTRVVLAGHLSSALSLADAPDLRIHARALGPRAAAISFYASRGRAGCAALRLGPAPALRAADAVAHDQARSARQVVAAGPG